MGVHFCVGTLRGFAASLNLSVSCAMNILAFLEGLEHVAVAIAATVTGTVAVLGLQSWRRELQGRAEFEVARNLARATYKLRDALASCRSPFTAAHEFPPGYGGALGKRSAEEEGNAWAHVYKNRWTPVWNALQDFDAHTLEAEALWGNNIRKRTDAMRKCVGTLNGAIEAYISNKHAGGEHFNDREFGKEVQADIWAMKEDENPLSKAIKEAVHGIEEQIRPHLKRS